MRAALGCAVVLSLLSGCSFVRDFGRFAEGDSAASDAGTSDGGSSDAGDDAGAAPIDAGGDAGPIDAGPRTCTPACAGDERCVDGACRAVTEARFWRAGSARNRVTALEADDDGNLYAVIDHVAPLTLGGTTYAPGGAFTAQVLASFDSELVLRWAIGLPSGPGDYAVVVDLRVDRLGVLFAVGTCRGNITIGATSRACAGGATLRLEVTPSGTVSMATANHGTATLGNRSWTSVALSPAGGVTRPIAVGPLSDADSFRIAVQGLSGADVLFTGLSQDLDLARTGDGRLVVVGDIGSDAVIGSMTLPYANDEFAQPLFVRLSADGTPAPELARTWPVKAHFLDVAPLDESRVAVTGETYDGNTVVLGPSTVSGPFTGVLTLEGEVVELRDTLVTPTRLERAGDELLTAWNGVPSIAPAGLDTAPGAVTAVSVGDRAHVWGWSGGVIPEDVVRTSDGRVYVAGQFRGVQRLAGMVVETSESEGVILEIVP